MMEMKGIKVIEQSRDKWSALGEWCFVMEAGGVNESWKMIEVGSELVEKKGNEWLREEYKRERFGV